MRLRVLLQFVAIIIMMATSGSWGVDNGCALTGDKVEAMFGGRILRVEIYGGNRDFGWRRRRASGGDVF